MKDLITEARELIEALHAGVYDDEYIGTGAYLMLNELCDALEKANSKLDYLHEDIGSVRAQLHTATFSTNKGAADMAKFILALLPAPPEEGGAT
jgi:hypothetical protein